MAVFDESSQSRMWMFRVQELVHLRNESNRRYDIADEHRKRIIYTVPDRETLEVSIQDANVQFLETSLNNQYSNDEVILRYFCTMIKHTSCSNDTKATIKRPWRVWCTAAVYLRRFYINNSLLAHDPRIVMLSCLFLSAKTENEYISVTELVSKVYEKCKEEAILEYELKVLEALNFDLRVLHPHNTSHAIISDMKRLITASDPNGGIDDVARQGFRNWVTSSEAVMNYIVISHLPLVFPPSILALAALAYTETDATRMRLEDYLRIRFGDSSAAAMLTDVQDVLSQLPSVTKDVDNGVVKVLLKESLRLSLWGKKSKPTV